MYDRSLQEARRREGTKLISGVASTTDHDLVCPFQVALHSSRWKAVYEETSRGSFPNFGMPTYLATCDLTNFYIGSHICVTYALAMYSYHTKMIDIKRQ